MATWMIQGTDKKEEMTEDGYRRLNAARNKEKALKDKPIVFVDDQGDVHEDVHKLTDAREAGLLAKEKEAQWPVPSSISLQVSAVCQTTCCGPPKCAVQERPDAKGMER